ncbi:MAG: protease modulator HflC [Gammaproteobacteria bacterium RIFCSPLOWO2_12_FULL_52_10]|nr:MAG: protease modulator HflC [Gammaproteobacteria bacterium RIFCSPLOWO2_12_FULL_52_10]
MNTRGLPVILIIVLMILGYFTLFTVKEWEKAVLLRFGEITDSDYGPGLHFKMPWMHSVRTFDIRLLNLDQDQSRFITSEKKDVIVDYYAKWRISDVRKFYQATSGGDVVYANNLLAQRINSALRDEFGVRTVQQVVAGERDEILKLVRETTKSLPDELGIEVTDVRTKRIDLPEEVSSSVYQRMRAERTRVAKDFRARGDGQAEEIRATADRDREVILAEAYRDAEMIRGEGDAKATEIYAAAYGKNEEFYAMYRSLSAYRNSFSNNDILLLQPDSDFFKYFNNPKGK